MDATNVDIRNTRARLVKLGIAALIGAVLTFFTVTSIVSDGRGPNTDPIGASSVGLLAIAIFVVTTMFAHKFISKKR